MNVIGIDLGGTKLAVALFSEDGKNEFKTKLALGNHKGHDVGKLIIEQIRSLISIARSEKKEISAIGISVPGIYYSDSGNVWAPNIPGWEQYPLLEEVGVLSEVQEVVVSIDSDRACYILGETWQGTAKGCSNAIFIAVGTGIGAGIMINGSILRGAHDIAGAIGWMALDNPYKTHYDSCGCFEYNASGAGIVKVAKELLAQSKDYSGKLSKKDVEQLTTYDIFEVYQSGDPIAQQVLDNSVTYWGMAVANLVSLFNPEKIIFGGGVFGPAAQFINRIKDEAQQWAQPISITKVTLEVSSLGGDAGLIGAAQLALRAVQK
jgi:glucokinase